MYCKACVLSPHSARKTAAKQAASFRHGVEDLGFCLLCIFSNIDFVFVVYVCFSFEAKQAASFRHVVEDLSLVYTSRFVRVIPAQGPC